MTLLLTGLLLALTGSAPAAEKVELTAEEKMILDLTNQERAKEKLPPLKPHPILMKTARAHSKNMAKHDKLAHELDGKKPEDRAEDAGYKGDWVGENVARFEPQFAPKDVVKGWMDSASHRKHILDKRYEDIGIGAARNAEGQVYWTQVFGMPEKP